MADKVTMEQQAKLVKKELRKLWEQISWTWLGCRFRRLCCRLFDHDWDDGDYEYAGGVSYYMGTGCRRCWHYEPVNRKRD